jgi:hypothetical protein
MALAEHGNGSEHGRDQQSRDEDEDP